MKNNEKDDFYWFIFLSKNCFGQNFILPLWPKEIPNRQSTNEVENRDSTDIVRIRHVQVPDIAVFLPAKKNATGMGR